MKKTWILRAVASLTVISLSSACASIDKTSRSSIDNIKLNPEYKMAVAKTAYKNNQYEEAINLYREVIDQEENNMKANTNLSAIYLDLGIKGMEYVGQTIKNKNDAETARELYEDINKKTHAFFSIVTPYISKNQAKLHH